MNAPARLLKDLRHQLARGVADFKAYDVPGLCVRLGLAPGDEQEAFSSKYRYASKRLNELDAATVLIAARLLLEEEENHHLSEVVARFEESSGRRITELTRRRIVAVFKGTLCTEIEEIEMIRHLWPIKEMPSVFKSGTYAAPSSLEDDIYQHTVGNYDWTSKDLLDALGILTCSQHQFFRFLETVTDPMVQTSERQAELVEEINGHLKHDGYMLAVSKWMSSSPVYGVRPAPTGMPADDAISAALQAFDPGHIHDRWTAALERRGSDPAGAITLARTLLEDVCKWILIEAGEVFQDGDTLPALYRQLSKTLKLAPDDHTEQVFKQILGNCQSIVESLGSVRNKLGDAHSPGPKRARPQTRHAELAVNLAGTMATFLVATWQGRPAHRPSA